ncbi:MAG TPA: serine/threonine-protein kinase [Acidimicrobiales bacterium]|nr:serine/threonine-protein kinase [Acidimicrobiales bacterium]
MRQIAGYRLLSEVGRGSMGVIWRAVQVGLEREVAIKLLAGHRAADAAAEARFIREGRALARLDHPNIVRVLDAGEADGELFLAMEYVPGTNLVELQALTEFGLPERLAVLEQVSGALEYAHSRKVVHRDLKPANVLVSRSGLCKVADFGIAKILDDAVPHSARTAMGTVLGSPSYMSPEQAMGEVDLTPQSDVYSLAVLAFELLVGHTPFPFIGGDISAALEAHLHQEPPVPRDLAPDFPEAVQKVLLAGLAKSPRHRPRTAAAFWRALSVATEQSAWPSASATGLPDLVKVVAGSSSGASDGYPDSTVRRRAGPDPYVTIEKDRGDAPVPDPYGTLARSPATGDGTVHRIKPAPTGVDGADTGGTAPPSGPPVTESGSGRPEPLPGAQGGGRVPWARAEVFRPKRRRRPALLLAAAVPVAVIAALLLAGPRHSAPDRAGLAVTRVSVSVVPPSARGSCPKAQFDFRGSIRTNGRPGALLYRWALPDGSTGDQVPIHLAAGTDQVNESLRFTYTGSLPARGAASLQVLRPTRIYSAPAPVEYHCP